MREDRFTNTEADAGRYERMRADEEPEPDVPTRAEAEADENYLHPSHGRKGTA